MTPPDDIRLSFNEVADAYDRIRPSYPGEMFEALFQLLPDAPEIIEVGPGTGQATRGLLDRGALVHAIEIGPAMAARLGANLGSDRALLCRATARSGGHGCVLLELGRGPSLPGRAYPYGALQVGCYDGGDDE